MGLRLPYGSRDYLLRHQYFSDIAFLPMDEKKPHLACIISDTFVSPRMMLRSEIHGVVALIKYQLARQHCVDHRIKPVSSSSGQNCSNQKFTQADMSQVMLYTFQTDQYARITEAYYNRDTGKILLRQSRQLDLRGTKPTDDAWLLMRWMLNTPVGDTLAKEKDCSLPIRVKEPVVSPMKLTSVVATPAVAT